MNDYERIVADLELQIQNIEAIDAIDPDIEHYLEAGVEQLQNALAMARERV